MRAADLSALVALEAKPDIPVLIRMGDNAPGVHREEMHDPVKEPSHHPSPFAFVMRLDSATT